VRNLYLLSYDIHDEERLHNVFTIALGYGERIQLSVFLCELSAREYTMLIRELMDTIDCKKDSVLLINIGQDKSRSRIKFLGKNIQLPERRAVII